MLDMDDVTPETTTKAERRERHTQVADGWARR